MLPVRLVEAYGALPGLTAKGLRGGPEDEQQDVVPRPSIGGERHTSLLLSLLFSLLSQQLKPCLQVRSPFGWT